MHDKTTDAHRKETSLEQKYDANGELKHHKENKIEIIKISTVSEIINVVTVMVVGVIGIVFIFTVAVGGLKFIANMTNNVEVQQ